MKIYAVSTGDYSDYRIEKVFSNKEAAEKYKKYHRCNDYIEEYEVYDSMEAADTESKPSMFMRVQGEVYPEALVNLKYEINPTVVRTGSITKGAGVHGFIGNRFIIYTYRYIDEDKWNEEKCKAKLTKSLYDYTALVKDMIADGANKDMINLALIGKLDEEEE